MADIIYVATSIDGYIADRNGSLDWLQMVPNPDNNDLGFNNFMSEIDAMVMGRTTFKTVIGFGLWPYSFPVLVYSRSGYKNFYIDGGVPLFGNLPDHLGFTMEFSEVLLVQLVSPTYRRKS